VSYTEQLSESLSEAEDTSCEWWECFDSPEEALQIISFAILESPDEDKVAQVLAFIDESVIYEDNMIKKYRDHLKKMKREVKRKANEHKNGDKKVE